MEYPDLNLLIALDALLEEESVVAASRRMNLSPPAMSRTLARIRAAFGDPILVQAGRKMVPTPRAIELKDEIHLIVAQATGVMQPADEGSIRGLRRVFTIRANDSVISAFGGALIARIRQTAPGVTLRFAAEAGEDDDALRRGGVDLFIGATEMLNPEVRVQALFQIAMIGVAVADHPLFDGEITPERFAAFDQVSVSRRGRMSGPIDTTLGALGLRRRVVVTAPSFSTALLALVDTDLLLAIPDIYADSAARLGLRTFAMPLDLPSVAVRQAWHPRFENDAAHRWLRALVREACAPRRSSKSAART